MSPPPLVAGTVPHTPPSVQIEVASPHCVQIVPLGGLTRWFRAVGYVVPILAHERDFDEQWSVEADDHEFAEALVREAEARAAIGRLHALDCVAVNLGRRKLVATLSRQPSEALEREQQERALTEQLVALEAVIDRLLRSRTYPRHGGRARLGLAVGLLGLAFAAGMAGFVLGERELVAGELGRLAALSLLASVPLTVVLVAALSRPFSGRSTSHKELCVVAVLALAAVPALGVGAAIQLNRLLDDGPAALHRLPVLELTEKRGEGQSVKHYAVVPDWREPGGPTRRVRLDRAQAAQAAAAAQAGAGGSWLRLTTSPGALGAERRLDLQLDVQPEDGESAH